MARIRSIKPEIRRSPTVCSWPYAIRWTFVGLPGYCDDEGRAIDDVRLIKAELYPIDDDMTARKLEQHLIAIATNGPLCRYEIDGKRYLHLTSFGEHQRVNRPTPSRIPPCPVHEKDVKPHAPLTEPSRPRAQARVPAEQGREQGKEQGAGSRAPATRTPQPPAPTVDDHDNAAHALIHQHEQAVGRLSNGTRVALLETIHDSLHRATPAQVATALDAYRDRAARGEKTLPGLLPRLIDDVLTAASAPTGTAGHRSGPKSRAAQTLELAERLEAAHGAIR